MSGKLHDFDSDRWSAGIGLVPLSGAGIDSGDNWVACYQTTDVAITLIALAPTLPYKDVAT